MAFALGAVDVERAVLAQPLNRGVEVGESFTLELDDVAWQPARALGACVVDHGAPRREVPGFGFADLLAERERVRSRLDWPAGEGRDRRCGGG